MKKIRDGHFNVGLFVSTTDDVVEGATSAPAPAVPAPAAAAPAGVPEASPGRARRASPAPPPSARVEDVLWDILVAPYKEVARFTEPLSMIVRTSLSGFR